MTNTPTPPPGWYPDPSNPGGTRYWDGNQWTADVATPPPGGYLPQSYGAAGPQKSGLPDVGDFLAKCFAYAGKSLLAILPPLLAFLAVTVLLGGALLASSNIDNWFEEIFSDPDYFTVDANGETLRPVPDFPEVGAAEVVILIALVVAFVVGSIAVYAVSMQVMGQIARGRDPAMPPAGAVSAACLRLFGVGLIITAIYLLVLIVLIVVTVVVPPIGIIGFLGMIPVAIWVGTRWSLVIPIVVLEGVVMDSFKRSWQRTANNFWGLFGRLLLYLVIISVASQILSSITGAFVTLGVSGAFALSMLFSIVIQIISSVFNASPMVVAWAALSPDDTGTQPDHAADPYGGFPR